MSPWLAIAAPAGALLLGILIGATITLIGHQSEETPAARRAALGRAAARARAQPPPLGELEAELEQLSFRRSIGGRPSGSALDERLHGDDAA